METNWMENVARKEEKGKTNQFVAVILREIHHLKDLDKDLR
jgi:hypothetical protein